MSTLANITSLNLSLQTGGAALAVNAVKSVAKPERVVYVFGTADDVAPNFTTLDGAVTYARSLVPDPDEPVVIRLFTKLDGTPYDLDGGDSWIVYAFESIYIYSDFKRLNTITDEVPSLLPEGLTIWYIDPNGVETLWVGREDGSAQLVGGALVGTFTPTFAVGDAGTITATSTLTYSKIGNLVRIYGGCSITTSSPMGFTVLGNLPFTPLVTSIGFYRIGALETTSGLTNSSYACNSSGGGIEIGDGSILDGQTSLFIDITYGA
jgi:hypothetical protein